MCFKLIFLLAILIGVGIAFYVSSKPPRLSDEELFQNAQEELSDRRISVASFYIEELLERNPESSRAIVLAAELQMREKHWTEALQLLKRIPATEVDEYATAQFTCGEIYRNMGELFLAEQAYENALSVSPEMSVVHERLALSKRLTGRTRAAERHLQILLENNGIRPEQLAWLSAPDQTIKADSYLIQCNQTSPEDPLPMFGLGMIALNEGRAAEAQQWLANGITSLRDPEALALLGRSLFEQDLQKELHDWIQSLSDQERSHESIQYVLGLINERSGQREVASTHFARTLQDVPDHQGALNHLATLLKKDETQDASQTLFERVKLVSRLESVLKSIQPQNPSSVAAAEIAEILTRLGRTSEARLWANLAGQYPPQATTAELEQISSVQQIVNSLAARTINHSDMVKGTSSGEAGKSRVEKFQFINQTIETGIQFQYFESPDPASEGRRMFEFTGGGVGVLDYDLDGWADLYFTQGTTWPPIEENDQFRDALYRHVDHRFVRIDDVAGITEISMSQGLSVGDINNDGFQDLYIANFGKNQFFLNNGDGTFSPLSDSQIQSASAWSTSCFIADIDNDGIPDLYDVNYLEGDGVEDSICQTQGGPRVCSPLVFLPAQDRLLLSAGNGTFNDITESSSMSEAGNGLGVLVANLDEDPQLEIFVANDLMENFLWDRQNDQDQIKFNQSALVKGFAFGSEGDAQACMGIAAADYDQDGNLDLFVTNYFNESNSLYMGDETGFTQDQSSTFGLRAPSLPMLGFGTQAIDADLDGDWDLVVANGDLDDFTHENRAFEMRPQLFENLDNKQFRDVASHSKESYFSKTYRGRGLAKVDWNRDGRCDFVVSHLDKPSALVTNLTEPAGNSLSLKLIGTISSRDAIGTSVRISSKNEVWQQQLTAGDGYQCSNERKLLFAVPEETPLTIEVTWPSGNTETFEISGASRNYIIIEKQGIFEEANLPVVTDNSRR